MTAKTPAQAAYEAFWSDIHGGPVAPFGNTGSHARADLEEQLAAVAAELDGTQCGLEAVQQERDEATQLAACGMYADRKATLRAAAVREGHATALRKIGGGQ